MTEAPGHPDDEPWGIGFGALLAHGANVDPTGGLDLLGGTPLQLGHAYQLAVHAASTADIALDAEWQLEGAPAGVTVHNTATLTIDGNGTGSALLPTLGHTLVSLTATGGDATTSFAVAGSGQRPLAASATGASMWALSAVGGHAAGPTGFIVAFPTFQTDSAATFQVDPGDNTKLRFLVPGVYFGGASMDFVASPSTLTGAVQLAPSFTDSGGLPQHPANLLGQPVDIRDATAGDPKEIATAQGVWAVNLAASFSYPVFMQWSVSYGATASLSAVEVFAFKTSNGPLV